MRIGDLNASRIGREITIRDLENETAAWVVKGRLVGVEHRIEEPHNYDPPKTATKVSIWVGPGEQTVTELVLPSDYEF